MRALRIRFVAPVAPVALVALVALGLSACAPPPAAQAPSGIAPTTRQLVVVTTPDWGSTTGHLVLWQRADANSPWTAASFFLPVTVGRRGLGWGKGLNGGVDAGPTKAEGDGRAPAGVFALGGAFGRGSAGATAWPYFPMGTNHRCVDDPHSSRYNSIVDTNTTPVDWTSSEAMVRADGHYDRGVVVQHNMPPGGVWGSCIFLHVWGGPSTPTIGCTAMDDGAIDLIVHWLDPSADPRLVQLPAGEYNALKGAWGLP